MSRGRSSARTSLLRRSGSRIPDLRLHDLSGPDGRGQRRPVIAVPGRKTFEEGHVPGADFLDLQGEFSDRATRLRFMMPATSQLEAAFGRHGFGRRPRRALQHRVHDVGDALLVDAQVARLEGAAVLDGGFDKWKARVDHGSGPARGYPPAAFKAGRDRLVRRQARGAGRDPGAEHRDRQCARAPFHKGLEPSRYGRPGAFRAASMSRRGRSPIRRRSDFTTLADAEAKFRAQGSRRTSA